MGKVYHFTSSLGLLDAKNLKNPRFPPLQCTLCDKKLQSRTSYRNHMKRHTEEKKHECEFCGKRFFTRYHLRLHQSKIHKETANAMDAELDDGVDPLLADQMDDVVYE